MSNEPVEFAKYHVDDEGHSVAGWVGVIIIVLGFLVGAFALFLNVSWLVWVAVALPVLGVILWMILRAVGFGPKDRSAEHRSAEHRSGNHAAEGRA